MYSVQLKNTKEIYDFCMINGITDINKFVQDCFKQGFDIERYGLLGKTGGEQEKWVEKEVIVEKRVEIPVEVIKEVEKIVEVIKEIPVEKVVEVTKEVPVEKVVEKIVEVTKEIPVEKVVIKEVVKEIPVEVVVTKTEYISDDTKTNELLLKIQQLEDEKQEFSTKTSELTKEVQKFSTKTQEMENIFQDKMSKKDKELDELRHSLDELLDKPPVEIIKEVYIEKQTENDNTKKLQDTLVKLRQNVLDKDSKIVELESKISELMRLQDEKKALYLRGSNLDDKLYK